MKTEDENHESDRLDELLGSWKVEAPLPPRFQEQVWRRIACAEEKPSWPVSAWVLRLAARGADLLRKPVGATAYFSVLLALGVFAGVWRSGQYAEQTEAAWRSAYLQAVTPTASPQFQP